MLSSSSTSWESATSAPVSPPKIKEKWRWSKLASTEVLRPVPTKSTMEDGESATAASMAREIAASKRRPRKLKFPSVTTVDASAISKMSPPRMKERRAVVAATRTRKKQRVQDDNLRVFDQHLPQDGRPFHLLKYGCMTEEPFLILTIRRWTAEYIDYLPADIVKRAMKEEAEKREVRRKVASVRISLPLPPPPPAHVTTL